MTSVISYLADDSDDTFAITTNTVNTFSNPLLDVGLR